ncbi:MAG: TrmJ/YjtD family RNA methyltransferase [Candidatus Heimdallarchaeota archaeon]|nr:TrmJ/YjtD family RNA methyltransferase [Candidatus Heimdallarchaeota archaeon]MCK4878248.1 TrmJ/YjtD family RNA methyltransferase [Candidatus Heimdallarchaeota archaeon]
MLEKKIEINYDVIILEPKIAGNIGAIARICNNFDVNNLVIVSPQVDHLSDEAKARAKHSGNYLTNAKVLSSIDEIREDYDFLIGTSAKAGSSYNVLRQPIFPWHLSKNIILNEGNFGIVFGREDKGLTNEELRMCDFLVMIPVPGKHKVLNISHAVGIIVYEIWKASLELELQIAEKQTSTYKEREVLFDKFTQITDILPYEEYRKPVIQHTFRNIVNRSFTNKEEIHALIGIFRTISNQLSTQE